METLKPEEQYRQKIDPWLEKYFNLDREVWSVCGKYRLDYILQCKLSKALLGLEVKSQERMRGNDFGKYLNQARNYTDYKWSSKFGVTKALIFITPAISNHYINITKMEYLNGKEIYYSQHESHHSHSNVNGLIGQICNIGEIRSFNHCLPNYFSFIYRNKVIWTSSHRDKIHQVNYDFYNDKL
jgi:hypothetical protein